MQRQGDAGPPGGIRWLGLGISVFVFQIALMYGLATMPAGVRWLPLLIPTAHLMLIPFLARNLSFWGMRLVLAGLILNLAAMLANGGLMPVEPSAVQAVGKVPLSELQPGEHVPGTKNRLLTAGDTRASFLSDRFVIPMPGPFGAAVSIGDFLVAGGVLIAYVEVVSRYSNRRGLPDG